MEHFQWEKPEEFASEEAVLLGWASVINHSDFLRTHAGRYVLEDQRYRVPKYVVQVLMKKGTVDSAGRSVDSTGCYFSITLSLKSRCRPGIIPHRTWL